jgi:cyanophycin synthetase
MKIIGIQALRGPNIWSISHGNLIQMRIDLEALENLSQLDLFNTIGSVSKSLDFEAWDANNFDQINNLSIAHVIEKLAISLQNLAGFSVNFSVSSKKKDKGIWVVVFEYQNEKVGESIADMTVKMINEIIQGREINIKNILLNYKGLPSKQLVNSNRRNIPIVAITGSNGKTTTTRLIAHILKNQGYTVGFTTSNGIYINDTMISEGDTTGPMSAKEILNEKSVNYAVLETARGGILRSGLGFQQCDMAVITNIQEDHLGISDIDTLDDLALVKGVVLGSVKKEGFAVLNADNTYTVKMALKAPCTVTYFSKDIDNLLIRNHCQKGGIAAILVNGWLQIWEGEKKINVQKVSDIPITFGGKVVFMVENVLAATLATYLQGIKPEDIAKSLLTFIPSADQTPGRLNIYDFKEFKVMVDFAHNLDAFKGIKAFLDTIDSPQKIGIIIGTGDRRDNDIRDFGRISAQMFDHILINQDKFLRGRTADEIVNLLIEGIKSAKTKTTYEYLPKGIEPLNHAIQLAKPGAFISALSDVLENPDNLVRGYINSYNS